MPGRAHYNIRPFPPNLESDEIAWPLLAPDGSAAAPSYSFADSTATGIFRTSTGTGALVFEAANTLAQRNGARYQTFRIYGTYTDADNYDLVFPSPPGRGVLTPGSGYWVWMTEDGMIIPTGY